VNDLIVVCLILKKAPSDYRIKCIGTNNTIDLLDRSFAFEIESNSTIFKSRGIDKSVLPGLEQGTVVTKTSNALMEYFQPTAFTRGDGAEITCKNGDKFYLSWFRLLTKPINLDDLSWYDSFGLQRIVPHISNKTKITNTINRIKQITAKELATYYEQVNDLFSHEKYKAVHSGAYIPNSYFIYKHYKHYNNKNNSSKGTLYLDKFALDKSPPFETYKDAQRIVKKEDPSATFSEILQKSSCEERAILFRTFPDLSIYNYGIYYPFAGFVDMELKKKAIFPRLKDILTMSNYMLTDRTYRFTRKNKRKE